MGFQYPQSGISPLQLSDTETMTGPGSGFSTLSRVLVLCNPLDDRLNTDLPERFQYPQSGISPLQLLNALDGSLPVLVSVPSVGY